MPGIEPSRLLHHYRSKVLILPYLPHLKNAPAQIFRESFEALAYLAQLRIRSILLESRITSRREINLPVPHLFEKIHRSSPRLVRQSRSTHQSENKQGTSSHRPNMHRPRWF